MLSLAPRSMVALALLALALAVVATLTVVAEGATASGEPVGANAVAQSETDDVDTTPVDAVTIPDADLDPPDDATLELQAGVVETVVGTNETHQIAVWVYESPVWATPEYVTYWSRPPSRSAASTSRPNSSRSTPTR